MDGLELDLGDGHVANEHSNEDGAHIEDSSTKLDGSDKTVEVNGESAEILPTGEQLDKDGKPIVKPVETKPENKDGKENDDDAVKEDEPLQAGTIVEIGEDKYTVDANGNLLDKDNKIFKAANEVKDFIKSYEEEKTSDDKISVDTIKDIIGVEITDENDKPIEFENTPEGIKGYINAVIENSKEEVAEATMNGFIQKYPFINEIINYYTANGNSLEGYGTLPDRSNITIDDNNTIQQENIIRTAWQENKRTGDVESYIAYLKSSNSLLEVSKKELEGLQYNDSQIKESLAQQAEEQKNAEIARIQEYWTGVKATIDKKEIAGYKIPDTITINKNGIKSSVTPNDFFSYIYNVNPKTGKSAYEEDLSKDDDASRTNDDLLRAYLKFTGGTYKDLVNMAINDKEVKTLKLKARTTTAKSNIRIVPSNTKVNDDFGY